MRMLNDNELVLVAGGNGSSDAYDNDGMGGNWYGYGTYGGGGGGGGGGGYWFWTGVAGSVTTAADGSPIVTANGGYWSYQPHDNGGGSNGGGSGGGDPVPPEAPPEQNDCRDRQALGIQTAINADSNHNTKEHGSVIYRGTDGALHSSPLFEGDERHIDPAVVRAWLTTNNIPMSSVVGFAHNHDAWYYGTSDLEAAVNRYPSGADWGFAGSLVADGAGGAGGAGFSLYIIDTGGDLREFEYSDRTAFERLNNSQKERGTDLPDETAEDGTTC